MTNLYNMAILGKSAKLLNSIIIITIIIEVMTMIFSYFVGENAVSA